MDKKSECCRNELLIKNLENKSRRDKIAAGAALIFVGATETIATGGFCPLCIVSIGAGLTTIKMAILP